jgi:hypothetical protein
MDNLPLGIQNFRKIIEGGYVYADKTQFVYTLLNDASYYFLSRPRRFGKSLLLDTIAEAFSGDKELFKGLSIYDSDYSFEKHPVLRLDMSNIANETPEALKDELSIALRARASIEGFVIDYPRPSTILKTLIEALYRKYNKRVVVLIDEYDKPILDNISSMEVAEANRDVLKGFYGVLKSMDPFLRLTFITGVTKFTKTSIFSGLNNLRDITLTKKYANICGITIDDLDKYFGEYIRNLAQHEEFRYYDNLRDSILEWYDGYSWDGKSRVINPFSLLGLFIEETFSGFWYASGTPGFLIDLIKQKPSSFLALNDIEISERALDTFDINKISIVPLLFQTGYLTVDETRFRGDVRSYLLKLPNREVREAFNLNIISEFTEADEHFTESAYWRIKESLMDGHLTGVLETLKGLFASIPYQLHISHEFYYHSIFFAIMSLLGFDIDAEVSVSGGRIDGVLEFDNKVYIMEFKYESCPADATPDVKQGIFDAALEKAMRQIEDRGYYKKYTGSGKAIYQAAFAFLGRDNIAMAMSIRS